ncbi:MAG: TIM barrel protein [Thermodesulfobacteriota bacterium]
MTAFSANLTFLFHERPFLERFGAARDAGFKFVETAFPYDHRPEEIGNRLREHDLKLILFNLPPGDLAAGELGLASDPGRMDDFRRGVESALERALTWATFQINCLVGRRRPEVPLEDQHRVLVENLKYAASRLAKEGRTLLIEPLNTYDFPGFLLSGSREAMRLLDEVGSPHLKLQYDLYHMQRMEGNLIATIRACLERIGHVQIGDNPDRLPPGTGEINVANVIRELDRLGYPGFIGLEYFAVPDTSRALEWMQQGGFQP